MNLFEQKRVNCIKLTPKKNYIHNLEKEDVMDLIHLELEKELTKNTYLKNELLMRGFEFVRDGREERCRLTYNEGNHYYKVELKLNLLGIKDNVEQYSVESVEITPYKDREDVKKDSNDDIKNMPSQEINGSKVEKSSMSEVQRAVFSYWMLFLQKVNTLEYLNLAQYLIYEDLNGNEFVQTSKVIKTVNEPNQKYKVSLKDTGEIISFRNQFPAVSYAIMNDAVDEDTGCFFFENEKVIVKKMDEYANSFEVFKEFLKFVRSVSKESSEKPVNLLCRMYPGDMVNELVGEKESGSNIATEPEKVEEPQRELSDNTFDEMMVGSY